MTPFESAPMNTKSNDAVDPMTAAKNADTGSSRSGRPTLDLRFVTRMSRELGDAVAAAAGRDGLTSGAWVRRLLMERVAVQSPVDARSRRPGNLPSEEIVAISTAVRELASVNAAISLKDGPAARAGLDRARGLLIPILMRHAGR